MDKKIKSSLVIILSIGIAMVPIGLWTWYLCTLPKLHEQLEYSPFYNEGEWNESTYGMTVVSNVEHEVVVKYSYNEKVYFFRLGYVSTRGFDHKYAAALDMFDYSIGNGTNENSFSIGGYKFNEENFDLYNVNYKYTGDNEAKLPFNDKFNLHFIKKIV